ncbi:hypothetical protein ASPBRDRAFT_320935 [Aspergillus brasiliensis CBS 101740]|uniref:Uncharacterized protein n=1 Tax=Aspergillus brasiliensis (strain CBS 101740 / IMI 381727 / IBT 21946) TaxID=767769 RepID=A0A1L9U989_ASPBC|nr:hypothetical protein ASPBRDRAFT_320935 [Aspergillus brasiliensis CBS 101740]
MLLCWSLAIQATRETSMLKLLSSSGEIISAPFYDHIKHEILPDPLIGPPDTWENHCLELRRPKRIISMARNVGSSSASAGSSPDNACSRHTPHWVS